VEESSRDHLPSIAAHTESISQKIAEIAQGVRPVAFSHVTEAAQAFLVAAIADEIPKTLWVLCSSVRSQELLYETLLNWQPNALFLPEAEIAAVENILPDPEIAAERLALLTRLQRAKGAHLVVATRAALDQSAPTPAALNAAVLVLRRGKLHPLEQTIEALVAAGYDRVAQVTTRGQFAVRGGIVDLFSWQAPRPIRIEYFGDDIE
jgi:transcription-repair coupling factor (superfamily II helicase)